jgi:hypothetical protein
MLVNAEHDGNAPVHTKVSVDTFVQWIRPCVSGLITNSKVESGKSSKGATMRKGHSQLVLNQKQVVVTPTHTALPDVRI